MSDDFLMRKLHIYIEKPGAVEQLAKCLAELEDMGVEVCIHDLSEAQAGDRLAEPTRETFRCQGQETLLCLGRGDAWHSGLEDGTWALYLTDVPQFASLLAAGNYPVIAYVHQENRQMPLLRVQYVIEGFEDVDAEYFVRIWQRLTGRPWQILETGRCLIRETTESDVDAFYEIYREPEITRYMEDLFADREEELQYTRDYRDKVYGFYGFGMWTVVLKETGRVIGRAGLGIREGFEEPELGFVIGVPWQRQGIAEEVCRGILQYGREELGFETVQAFVHPDNQPSIKLLEKLGFRYDTDIDLCSIGAGSAIPERHRRYLRTETAR